MPDTTSPPSSTDRIDKKHPYAILGGLVLGALVFILSLAAFGVSGPSAFPFPADAALWAIGSFTIVLTAAMMFLFFTLRSPSRLLAQHELKLQSRFEQSQNLRLQSLEDSRVGSSAGGEAQDGRLDSLEGTRDDDDTEAATLLRVIARLEARIERLEQVPGATPVAEESVEQAAMS